MINIAQDIGGVVDEGEDGDYSDEGEGDDDDDDIDNDGDDVSLDFLLLPDSDLARIWQVLIIPKDVPSTGAASPFSCPMKEKWMEKKTKASQTTSGLFRSEIRVVGSNDSSILFLILILS